MLQDTLKTRRLTVTVVAAAILIMVGIILQMSRAYAVSGLVAAYGFNEGSGTTLGDTSGNNNNGAISGATWNTGGKYGKALSFDGVNDIVNIADSNSLDLTTGMTLEAWVKPTSLGSSWRTAILKEQSGDMVYSLYAHNGSRPEGYIYAGGAERFVTGTAAITNNTWTHLSVTYNGSILRFYVNGTQVATKNQTGNITTSTGALRIGGNNVWSEWFSGLIDEVRIYDHALTATEIQTDMNTPIEVDTTAPTTPTNLTQSGATATSVTVGWTASTDNVGVTGYRLTKNSASAGTTANTSATFSNLACGTDYVIGVDAYDAADNHSLPATVTASTSACDTTAPSVSLTAPADGATVSGSSVALSANASDNVSVAGVQFKVDGTNVGSEDTQSPYTVNWNSAAAGDGPHTITAVVRDSSNNTTTSSTVNVTANNADSTPPTVSMTAPASGATVSGSSVAVSANASDNVGVAGVQFKLDGNNLNAEDTSSPYSINWNSTTASNGSHTLTAVARDAAGNTTTATSVSVTVSNDTTPPSVSVTAPADGATVSGSTVQLSANASDNVSVSSVQFKVDGTNVGSADTSAPYEATWNSSGVANGSHVVTAVATDSSNNTTTSSNVTVTVSNSSTIDPSKAYVKVSVGPGFVEASSRQVMRTPGNQSANADTVYIITSDDSASGDAIHIWKGNTGGIPTAFTEQDAAHHPTPSSGKLGSPDARLDRSGIVHIVYHETGGTKLYYQTFSTITNQWGARTQLASNAGILTMFNDRTGNAALILDNDDVPHIVYTTSANTVVYLNKVGGTWSSPQTLYTGTRPIHPALATDASGVLQVTWLDNSSLFNTGNTNRNNPAATVKYAQRSAGGTWGSVETVESTNVENNVYLDQGPNIALKTNGTPYVLFIDANEHMQVRYRTGVNTWATDTVPTSSYGLTHTPTIHTEGDDLYLILGHDVNIHYGYMSKLSGQSSWSAFTTLDTTQNDGSASTRWDPVRQTNSNVIDTIYFNETIPQVYYMALLPQGTGTPPPPDSTPPTVSMTAPASGATVSGSSVAVSANASDNVGVAGVQFKLDGNNLNAEDTSSPYSINWNSTTASNGSHTLTAVARDAAGNTTTATSVSVTVSNSSSPVQLVGNNNIETNVDSVSGGQAEAFRFTATNSGTLATLNLYVDSGTVTNNATLGLYTNNNNHPGTLLSQATITGVTKGAWNSVTMPGTSITSGQTYWIAVLSPIGNGQLKFRDRIGGGASEVSASSSLSTLPSAWVTGSTFTDSMLSVYGSSQ